MEAFFSSVKSEAANRFASGDDAKVKLFDYVEVFYNQRQELQITWLRPSNSLNKSSSRQ